MTIPDSDAYNWVIGPILRAIQYVGEETALAGTLQRSLIVLENHEGLLRAARDRVESAGALDIVSKIDQLLRDAPALGQRAAELRKGDFAVVNSHSLIGMWGAVEVAVEDTIVLILSKEPATLQIVSEAGIKTSAYEPGPVSEEDGRRLYSRLERSLREKLRVGEAYARLWELFGIQFNCSKHVLSKLEEINAVRNCLLHRGGIIDDRAAQAVGALRSFLGKSIQITSPRYLEYYDAISTFLQAASNGVIKSKYIRINPALGGAT
jgi:hypothetical protein